MEDVIASIQLAVAADATPEARAAGIVACRAVLGTLEATQGAPLAAPVPSLAQFATLVMALREMPADVMLDMAIARLRAAMPAGTEPPAVKPINLRLVPLPRGGGS